MSYATDDAEFVADIRRQIAWYRRSIFITDNALHIQHMLEHVLAIRTRMFRDRIVYMDLLNELTELASEIEERHTEVLHRPCNRMQCNAAACRIAGCVAGAFLLGIHVYAILNMS